MAGILYLHGICAPFPDVSSQILQSQRLRAGTREQAHRRRLLEFQFVRVADPVLPVVSPRVHERLRATGRGFPFQLAGQPAACPVCKRLRLPERNADHRLIGAVPFRLPPIFRLADVPLLVPLPAFLGPTLALLVAAILHESAELGIGHGIAGDEERLRDLELLLFERLDRISGLAPAHRVRSRRHLDPRSRIGVLAQILGDPRIAHSSQGQSQFDARLDRRLAFNGVQAQLAELLDVACLQSHAASGQDLQAIRHDDGQRQRVERQRLDQALQQPDTFVGQRVAAHQRREHERQRAAPFLAHGAAAEEGGQIGLAFQNQLGRQEILEREVMEPSPLAGPRQQHAGTGQQIVASLDRAAETGFRGRALVPVSLDHALDLRRRGLGLRRLAVLVQPDAGVHPVGDYTQPVADQRNLLLLVQIAVVQHVIQDPVVQLVLVPRQPLALVEDHAQGGQQHGAGDQRRDLRALGQMSPHLGGPFGPLFRVRRQGVEPAADQQSLERRVQVGDGDAAQSQSPGLDRVQAVGPAGDQHAVALADPVRHGVGQPLQQHLPRMVRGVVRAHADGHFVKAVQHDQHSAALQVAAHTSPGQLSRLFFVQPAVQGVLQSAPRQAPPAGRGRQGDPEVAQPDQQRQVLAERFGERLAVPFRSGRFAGRPLPGIHAVRHPAAERRFPRPRAALHVQRRFGQLAHQQFRLPLRLAARPLQCRQRLGLARRPSRLRTVGAIRDRQRHVHLIQLDRPPLLVLQPQQFHPAALAGQPSPIRVGDGRCFRGGSGHLAGRLTRDQGGDDFPQVRVHLLEERFGRASHLLVGRVQAPSLNFLTELADLGVLVQIDFVESDLGGLKVKQNPRFAGFSPAAQGVAEFLLRARSVAAGGRAKAAGQHPQVHVIVGGRLGIDDVLGPRPDLRHDVVFPFPKFQPHVLGAYVGAVDALDHLVQHAAFFRHVAGRGNEDADQPHSCWQVPVFGGGSHGGPRSEMGSGLQNSILAEQARSTWLA